MKRFFFVWEFVYHQHGPFVGPNIVKRAVRYLIFHASDIKP